MAPEPSPTHGKPPIPDGIDWHAEIPVAPLTDILDRSVEAWPDRPCLTFMGKSFTYAEVGDLVNRAARGFQDLGVDKGVRVGLFLPNSPYFIICYYAVLKAGGTVVNFNPLYAEREIERQVEGFRHPHHGDAAARRDLSQAGAAVREYRAGKSRALPDGPYPAAGRPRLLHPVPPQGNRRAFPRTTGISRSNS